jgi:CHAT domain-containing protein
LHAAGHHETRADAVPRTVPDRVVSSSTPTIRALIHARRPRPGQAPDSAAAPLVVAMPRTPGAADLPGAALEASLLRQRFGQAVVLSGRAATREAVTAAMGQAAWAHFACHAEASPASPSASCLLLADHLTRPLTVADVAALHLEHADLAFLSACGTARTPSWLADEAIHLSSAFQLAGYRHVIATLWPVEDGCAAQLADDAYAALAATPAAAAAALHAAAGQLRDRLPRVPSAWAAYIHTGP